MRKKRWRAFELDDMCTVAARSWQEAAEWFMKECGLERDDINYPPPEVDMKRQYMSYTIRLIPTKRRRRATAYTLVPYEGYPCVDIPLKRALRYELRKNKPQKPFILAVYP
ncbi:hypothetical protein DFR58_101115 [Anaerobacterium chartisolvens]|uniref:Uncharacterized protein n=1 Tax=Anaerobacterium chartisolvens TaxID=1297424 RepID=A0A369BH85_9FIRM|nr:hypothetical protein [Anaerobacterium chartisolvens]RCX20913.1 hypothetical protein DFR58_101115 [Anaerobacterium chartisolvens]